MEVLQGKPRAFHFNANAPVSLFPPRVAKGHPMSDDAHVVYLFQCASDDLFAVTHDMTGANLPRDSCAQGWMLRDRFQLGEYASIPAPIGYYIWRDSCWTQRTPRSSSPTI